MEKVVRGKYNEAGPTGEAVPLLVGPTRAGGLDKRAMMGVRCRRGAPT